MRQIRNTPKAKANRVTKARRTRKKLWKALSLAGFKKCRTPCDAYFKKTIERPEVAEALIRAFLPKIAEQIQQGSLEAQNSVLTSYHLHERRADQIFKALIIVTAAEVLLLLDHKSRPDHLAPEQLAVYALLARQLWASLSQNKGKLLPPIELIIFFNGDGTWNAATRYSEKVDPNWNPSSQPIDFGYTVIDLKKVPDEFLYELGELGVALFALKYAPRLRRHPWALDKILELLADMDCEFVDLTISYLLLVCDEDFRETVLARAQMAARKEKPMYVTIADSIRRDGVAEGMAKGKAEGKAEGMAQGMAKGKAEGRTKGRAEGKADTLLTQLTQRFNQIPPTTERRVRKASEARLDAWLGRILVADSIEDVFQNVRASRTNPKPRSNARSNSAQA